MIVTYYSLRASLVYYIPGAERLMFPGLGGSLEYEDFSWINILLLRIVLSTRPSIVHYCNYVLYKLGRGILFHYIIILFFGWWEGGGDGEL